MRIRHAVRWAAGVFVFLAAARPLVAQGTNAGNAPRQPAGANARAPAAESEPRTSSAKAPRAPQVDRPVRPAADLQPGDAARPKQKPAAERAPFELTAEEEQHLDELLKDWEDRSTKIKTFKCSFDRWEYDRVNGLKHIVRKGDREVFGEMNALRSIGDGQIKFKSPDHGSYKDNSVRLYRAPPRLPDTRRMTAKQLLALFELDNESRNHWVCDGQSIFQYEVKEKVLHQFKLPPELQGKAITNGPIPFVFGAKVDNLRNRYWMREVTPHDTSDAEIWLEAHPRHQQDAAEFVRATIILDSKTMLPLALETRAPGDTQWTAYAFKDHVVNDPLALVKGDFLPPLTPLGWTKEVEEAPVAPPGALGPFAGRQAAKPPKTVRPK